MKVKYEDYNHKLKPQNKAQHTVLTHIKRFISIPHKQHGMIIQWQQYLWRLQSLIKKTLCNYGNWESRIAQNVNYKGEKIVQLVHTDKLRRLSLIDTTMHLP